MNFSIEISPSTDLETLPAIKDVYITLLPGGDFKETADQAEKLVKNGFNPIPHIPARAIENEAQLKEYISRCKDGGTKQVLVIGGSREPIGKFDSSFQLLETGYFADMKIGIAGHPEGSPDISDSILEKAMNDKVKFIFCEGVANPGGIILDLEKIGKFKRQGHLNTWKSDHTMADVVEMRKIVPSGKLIVRLNKWNKNST